jgi:hypothetical protein
MTCRGVKFKAGAGPRNHGRGGGVSPVVCYVSDMTRRLFAVLALGLALAFAGCSENRPGDIRRVLPISAVAYNDSVAGGDTLYLKVQYAFTSTCEQHARFEIQAVAGTSTYQVVPVAVFQADDPCTGVNGTDIATLRVTDVGNGARTFQILGANQTITANVLGSTDPTFVKETGIAFRVLVQDAATGAAIPAALVTIRRLDDNFTLADGVADGSGRFDFTEPCPGAGIAYVVSAAASGHTTNMIVRTPPAQCGIPEFVVIRV